MCLFVFGLCVICLVPSLLIACVDVCVRACVCCVCVLCLNAFVFRVCVVCMCFVCAC